MFNIELSPDEVDFAVHMYMAIKGYTSDHRQYDTHYIDGLKQVTCVNVKPINANIDWIIEQIKSR